MIGNIQATAETGSFYRAAFTEITSFIFTMLFLLFSIQTSSSELSLITNPVFVTEIFIALFTLLQIALYLVIYPKIYPSHFLRDFPTKKRYGLQQKCKYFSKCIITFAILWVSAHFFAVIFGAPLIDSVEKTAVWAALTACLISVPGLCVIGPKPRKWLSLFNLVKFDSPQKRSFYYSTVGTVVGSWASSVVIPLDWDRPWQLWPVPGIVGAMLGYAMGVLLGGIKIYKDLKFSKLH